MAKREKTAKPRKRPIERYDHKDKERIDNPPVGLVTLETDPPAPTHKTYGYDPHLDPQLVWAGKKEHTSFEVPTVSLHVHERIDPRTIVEAVRKRNGNGLPIQPSLFEQPKENPPLREAIDFYRHPHGWSNRLIAGDSLLVMNSLLEKEGMAGQVQMVYIDPPYGIKYGSNFQPFVNKRDVKDGKDEDLTQEPEMIRAFRDTWELDIHSYLTYLRDRLLLARELLHQSGSCLVQISDENLHLVRNLLDEIFGSHNRCVVILYKKTGYAESNLLPSLCDFILWYAKDKTKIKYNKLFREKTLESIDTRFFDTLEYPNGERRQLTPDEINDPRKIPDNARILARNPLVSPGWSEKLSQPIEFEGEVFPCPPNAHWKTTPEGIEALKKANRLIPKGKTLRFVHYLEDLPVGMLGNYWSDTGSGGFVGDRKIYVVQTDTRAVARCVLMTTDPGDLVFDPTCGSGTTAYVAEEWGRRWITCDTSRVAITLAKQRLMTAVFDYYELAHPEEGVGSGFRYKTVPHVTLKSIAKNPEIREGITREQIDAVVGRYADQETLYDQPYVDKSKVRVTGPFTMEAVPAPTVRSLEEIDEGDKAARLPADPSIARSGPALRQDEWRDELLKTGIRGKGGQMINFSRVEPLGGTRWLHADAETKGVKPERVVVSFGPEHGPLEQRQVELAWEEARTLIPRPSIIVFAAFQFDPEAAKDIDELTKEKTSMTFLTAQMNGDLLTDDLKKKRSSNQSFWLVGRPDVEVRHIKTGEHKGKCQVEVLGFDYFNTRTGTIESGDPSKIAIWLLDTDYDGRSLYPRQVFFPMAGDDEGWARLARNLKAEIVPELIEAYRGKVSQRDLRLFFCQLEAIETLIWLTEAPEAERLGVEIPSDGGQFHRLCSKMATGSGKTIVMAMLIAWQILNKVTYPQDKRFSKHIFVVAPGLTVKSRLQVLLPGPNSYYEMFRVIPPGLEDKVRQGQTCRILVRNWHTLDWETEAQLKKKRSVDKRGPKSDEAYVRDVLEDMASAQNIVVINDEAHHAWRVPPKTRIRGVAREEVEEATKWVGGLDRIHRARGILTCFDLTATPFAPTGRKSGEETLFGWIVSDFGLNDAIESGLVKTPRVVVRDDGVPDAKTYKSKLYHIYQHVKSDLNRKAKPEAPLPDLVLNGYYLLGKDWLETAKKWNEYRQPTPPVMITVANRTETAARVEFAFSRGKVRIEELCAPEKILHIDSSVLSKAEARDEPVELELNSNSEEENAEDENETPKRKLSKKDYAELLRRKVDTVGRIGEPGEQIQKVISVGMLSEGWDAKTVTHIMGLRAFTSQLLCEQVVGRGLRRTSYEVDEKSGLYRPEYVNIFGVPFTFMPHEGSVDSPPPPPPAPKTRIESLADRKTFEIAWPNVIRIDHEFRPRLSLDLSKVKPLVLDAAETRQLAEVAPTIDGKPDVARIKEISLDELGRRFRMQKIIFSTASDLFDQMSPDWKGSREYLLAQLIRLVEKFLESGHLQISAPFFAQDDLRRRIVLTLNMSTIVQHMWEAIRYENALTLEPVPDRERPIRSTGDMAPWYTGRPCERTKRSHINMCVFDSAWEASEAFELDRNPNVAAWAKNDHLGFEIKYTYRGIVRDFRPDYLVRLKNGKMLVLEVKGQDTQEQQTKRQFLTEWIRAVNDHGGFGAWASDVSYHPKDVLAIVERHLGSEAMETRSTPSEK